MGKAQSNLILWWGDLRYRWLGSRNQWDEISTFRGKEYCTAFRRALILGLLERVD